MPLRSYGGYNLGGLRLPGSGSTLLNTKTTIGGPASVSSPIRPDDLLNPTGFGKAGETPLSKLPQPDATQSATGPLEALRNPPSFQIGPRPTASAVIEEPLPVPQPEPQPSPSLDPRIDPRWTPGPLNPSGPFNPDPRANPIGWNDPTARNLERINHPWERQPFKQASMEDLIDSSPATTGPKENPLNPDSPRNPQNMPAFPPDTIIDAQPGGKPVINVPLPETPTKTTPNPIPNEPVVTYPGPTREPPAPDPLNDAINQRYLDLLAGKNPAMEQAERAALNALGGQQKNSERAAHEAAVRMGLAPGTPGYQEVVDNAARNVTSTGSDLLSGLAQKGLDQQNAALTGAGNFNYRNRVFEESRKQSEVANLDSIIQNPNLFSVDQVNQAKAARASIVGAGSGGRPDDPAPVMTKKALLEIAKARGEADPQGWADAQYKNMTDAQFKGLLKAMEENGLVDVTATAPDKEGSGGGIVNKGWEFLRDPLGSVWNLF